MNSESKAISFLRTINYVEMTAREISTLLFNNGFTIPSGMPYSVAQVNSLLHSLNQLKRKASFKKVESCGIDRENNPCGDASDY